MIATLSFQLAEWMKRATNAERENAALVQSIPTDEQRDLDVRNAGAVVTAQKLREIAITGEHPGTFGSEEIEAAAQTILTLRRQRDAFLPKAVENARLIHQAKQTIRRSIHDEGLDPNKYDSVQEMQVALLRKERDELTKELERWRSLHGADDPEDAIAQDAKGQERKLILELHEKHQKAEADAAALRKEFEELTRVTQLGPGMTEITYGHAAKRIAERALRETTAGKALLDRLATLQTALTEARNTCLCPGGTAHATETLRAKAYEILDAALKLTLRE